MILTLAPTAPYYFIEAPMTPDAPGILVLAINKGRYISLHVRTPGLDHFSIILIGVSPAVDPAQLLNLFIDKEAD